MKSTGIVRKVDKLGRCVLPKETRDMLDLPEGTPLEIYVDGQTIVLKKYSPGCIFCDFVEGAELYKGKQICKKCRAELKKP